MEGSFRIRMHGGTGSPWGVQEWVVKVRSEVETPGLLYGVHTRTLDQEQLADVADSIAVSFGMQSALHFIMFSHSNTTLTMTTICMCPQQDMGSSADLLSWTSLSRTTLQCCGQRDNTVWCMRRGEGPTSSSITPCSVGNGIW